MMTDDHHAPHPRRWPGTFLMGLGLGLFLLSALPVRAQNTPAREWQLKAAFLLNFIQFIQWPAEAHATSTSPIVVGILGNDPFGTILEQTFTGESVRDRQIIVRRSRDVNELKNVHMLYVCSSERNEVPAILRSLGETPVVTVSDLPEFTRRGGIIGFYIESNKIRFEINADAAQRRQIRIHSQLLARARVVGPNPGRS